MTMELISGKGATARGQGRCWLVEGAGGAEVARKQPRKTPGYS